MNDLCPIILVSFQTETPMLSQQFVLGGFLLACLLVCFLHPVFASPGRTPQNTQLLIFKNVGLCVVLLEFFVWFFFFLFVTQSILNLIGCYFFYKASSCLNLSFLGTCEKLTSDVQLKQLLKCIVSKIQPHSKVWIQCFSTGKLFCINLGVSALAVV